MQLYSLGKLCALFAIDPVTLRRWMRRINISPHVDPSDACETLLAMRNIAEAATSLLCLAARPGAALRKLFAILHNVLATLVAFHLLKEREIPKLCDALGCDPDGSFGCIGIPHLTPGSAEHGLLGPAGVDT